MNSATRALGIGLSLCVAIIYTGGCAGSQHCEVETTSISPEEFRRLYSAPRTPINFYQYEGVVAGYHVLDYYSPGFKSIVKLQKRYRVPIGELPADFPSTPQLPMAEQDESMLLPPHAK